MSLKARRPSRPIRWNQCLEFCTTECAWNEQDDWKTCGRTSTAWASWPRPAASRRPRSLQLSKASVSQRIAELEKAVGLPLVRRTTRGVSLTEAGAHLVEQTAAAFQRIEAGYSAVKDLSGGPGACWP